MAIASVKNLALRGKKVLLRCDFNVPLESGRITDPERIDASLETIRYILRKAPLWSCVPIWAVRRNARRS